MMQSMAQLPEVNCDGDAELLELNLLGNSAPSALYFVRSNNRWFAAKGSFHQRASEVSIADNRRVIGRLHKRYKWHKRHKPFG